MNFRYNKPCIFTVYNLRFTISLSMTKYELMERFKRFAIDVARLVLILPYTIVNKSYSDQLNISASGAAANYRAALRGKSTADFLNKLKIVEEELDESIFFLELIEAVNPNLQAKTACIKMEASHLLAIIVASIRTIRAKQVKL